MNQHLFIYLFIWVLHSPLTCKRDVQGNANTMQSSSSENHAGTRGVPDAKAPPEVRGSSVQVLQPTRRPTPAKHLHFPCPQRLPLQIPFLSNLILPINGFAWQFQRTNELTNNVLLPSFCSECLNDLAVKSTVITRYSWLSLLFLNTLSRFPSLRAFKVTTN